MLEPVISLEAQSEHPAGQVKSAAITMSGNSIIIGRPQRVYQWSKILNCALPLREQEGQGRKAECNTVFSLSSGGTEE